MKRKKTLSIFLLGIAAVLLLLLSTYMPCLAAEIRHSVPSYVGEELEKVREWEKTWVGKMIDHTNVDQVKEFLTEPHVEVIKNPETWKDARFEIVPYREILPSPGDLKFTLMYKGKCSIGPNEEILNYVCGIPFPEPKTGLEIAYNFDKVNLGDTLNAYQDAWTIDGRRGYDRKFVMDGHGCWFTGRREVDPTPQYPNNPKKIFRAFHSEYLEPASMRGTRGLAIKWQDTARPYGSWGWSSATRRVTRRSSASRQDSVGGTDMTMDDNMIYDNVIPAQNYKIMGRKELLVGRHQDMTKLKSDHIEGVCYPLGAMRERVNTWMLEVINKDPNYVYSKQIYYCDPETWYISWSTKYDRTGKLWKTFDMFGNVLKNSFNEAEMYIGVEQLIIDMERQHATGGPTNPIPGIKGKEYEPPYYEPRALQKYGY